MNLEERHKVSFRGCAILHAAQAPGTDVLYPEDLSGGHSTANTYAGTQGEAPDTASIGVAVGTGSECSWRFAM
jgi:hypothetical protein